MSEQFISVYEQKNMDEFLCLVDSFHDAILREIGIVSQGYVDVNGYAFGDTEPSDARLVIHSQFQEAPYIEIIFEDIQLFRWESNRDLDPACGVATSSEVKLTFGPSPDNFMVLGRRMKYRILGHDFLGKECRTVKQIYEDDNL